MKNKTLIRFVQSLVLVPVMTMSMASPSMNVEKPSDGLVKKVNSAISGMTPTLAIDKVAQEEDAIRKLKAEAIDEYFSKYDMPLEGTGMKMVLEAEKNDIDWRLIPAISVRESTGGIHACKKATFNPFGWGSCKISFKSNDVAIETLARNLGGNNPNTDHHYAGKTTKEILQKYNPPSVVKYYAEQVMKIMDNIGPEEITLDNTNA